MNHYVLVNGPQQDIDREPRGCANDGWPGGVFAQRKASTEGHLFSIFANNHHYVVASRGGSATFTSLRPHRKAIAGTPDFVAIKVSWRDPFFEGVHASLRCQGPTDAGGVELEIPKASRPGSRVRRRLCHSVERSIKLSRASHLDEEKMPALSCQPGAIDKCSPVSIRIHHNFRCRGCALGCVSKYRSVARLRHGPWRTVTALLEKNLAVGRPIRSTLMKATFEHMHR